MPTACTICKTISADSESIVPGSTTTEVLLWLIFLLPGVVYSIWRANGRKNVCPTCKSAAIVPLSSPMGQEIQRAFPVPEPPTSEPLVYGENTPDSVKYMGVAFLVVVCIFFLWSLLK